ncbi:MAG: helix-hairpin-helix domain-containing protein [Saprospiraceae bacterium]
MRYRKKWILFHFTLPFCCFLFYLGLQGQKNDLNTSFDLSSDLQLLIEEYLGTAEGENTTDVLEVYEYLEQVYQNKLDINKVNAEDLNRLQLLTDIQANNFLIYRNAYGPFISIYELQAIPSFDHPTIQRVVPFLRFEEKNTQNISDLSKSLKSARHEIIFRSQRNLEELSGSLDNGGFVGDPYRHYLRYKFKADKITAGLVAEKDIGESFFRGNNKAGFDYYSYHLSIKDLTKNLNRIILGDYTVSMGQGLILHNQFGRGISSFTTNIKKRNGSFRQYTSRNEVNYFKGAAIDIDLNDHLKFKIFGSRNNIDGTLKDLDNNDQFESFSAINNSGNHRTESEILKKNQITRTSYGAIVTYLHSSSKLSVNILSDNFNKIFNRTFRADNIFFARQKNYNNISIDYSHSWRGINIFGESAYSDTGGMAHMIGALFSLDPKFDLAIGYRNYARTYVAITPNSFGQGSNSSNEKGTYIGIEYRFNKHFSLNAYADFWKNPWLRFRVDSPGKGTDFLMKLNYIKKRKMNIYMLFKTEIKLRNSIADAAIDFTTPQRITRMRFHISNKITSGIELRNRAEIAFYKSDEESHKGIILYQDILYRAIGTPFSFTTRFLWFDVEDFDARIYTYENDVLNDFFVPFFSGNGIRFYFNLRYKANRNTTLELRWAQTRYFDRETISSGLTEINGSVNTNVKAQVRLRF